jgi:hypothetical protein
VTDSAAGRLARVACESLLIGLRHMEPLIDEHGFWPGGMAVVWPPVFDEARWAVPLGWLRGWLVAVTPMIYTDRLTLGNPHDVAGYEHGWCYPKGMAAVSAAVRWRVHVDAEPPGHLKRATTGRFTLDTWAR